CADTKVGGPARICAHQPDRDGESSSRSGDQSRSGSRRTSFESREEAESLNQKSCRSHKSIIMCDHLIETLFKELSEWDRHIPIKEKLFDVKMVSEQMKLNKEEDYLLIQKVMGIETISHLFASLSRANKLPKMDRRNPEWLEMEILKFFNIKEKKIDK